MLGPLEMDLQLREVELQGKLEVEVEGQLVEIASLQELAVV